MHMQTRNGTVQASGVFQFTGQTNIPGRAGRTGQSYVEGKLDAYRADIPCMIFASPNLEHLTMLLSKLTHT